MINVTIKVPLEEVKYIVKYEADKDGYDIGSIRHAFDGYILVDVDLDKFMEELYEEMYESL